MMEALSGTGRGPEQPTLLAKLFERLEVIPGYTWDSSVEPFHSSYDNWHVFGTKHGVRKHSSRSDTFPASERSVSPPSTRPPLRTHRSSASASSSDSASEIGSTLGGSTLGSVRGHRHAHRTEDIQVVARVSSHTLRLEREFSICKMLMEECDPKCEHIVRPVELVRLAGRPGQESLAVFIVETPGKNYLKELVEFGPNWYRGTSANKLGEWAIAQAPPLTPGQTVPLLTFLEFAIGAAECCELLHHRNRIVHGELRADAFHYNNETSKVKLINFGSGARSFENGLTSAGWSSLSREVGIEHKLQFIAPEQTGRLPAEPDSRTDIYSLGILFWTMLTGEEPFEGYTPLDIMQNVLSRRIPPVSVKRLDVPEVLSAVIQKMTQKKIDDRYNSTSGLRYDLGQIQKYLQEGDGEGLKAFEIATKDVSCFFNLPTTQIGRQQERKIIIDVIEKVSRRQAPTSLEKLYSLSSNSSISEHRGDSFQIDDAISDSTSSTGGESRMNSGVGLALPSPPKHLVNRTSRDSIAEVDETQSEGQVDTRPSEVNPTGEARTTSMNSITSVNTVNTVDSDAPKRSASVHHSENNSLLRSGRKYKRKGKCEIIGLSGGAGFGKSCLVQSIQMVARQHGYFSSAKFDSAKRAPFDPILRAMASLFRQIFSESNVNTDFHETIRCNIGPVWPILHKYLDLPPWLLGPTSTIRTPNSVHASHARFMELAHDREGTTRSPGLGPKHCGSAGATAADWLRSGGSSKAARFIQTIIDVLRLLGTQKFLCICLDDLQFADEESLELIQFMVTAKTPVLLILTYRQEDALSTRIQNILSSATKIALQPFSEEETAEYVSTTLHRPKEYVLPLVAVIQQKTRGNPFFVREMLDTCYRKGCVFYSWTDNQWEYDLDLIFKEFASESYGDQINNEFIVKRLLELSPATRTLLAWASLVGSAWSFGLIKQLMNQDTNESGSPILGKLRRLPSHDPVQGLQGALNAYIIMPAEEEDRFRFAHDRYLQAASTLPECEHKEDMHLHIAEGMIRRAKRDGVTPNTYTLSRHICTAVEVIKRRVLVRQEYRDILFQAAESACDSGARQTGLYFFSHCLSLLQKNPWDDSLPDVDYQETLNLFIKSAECYWYQGMFEPALGLIHKVFEKARDAVDKAPCWILQSRVFAQRGDSFAALQSLKQCLASLGIQVEETTWEECDAEFYKLYETMKTVDKEDLLARPPQLDRVLCTIGSVLVECLSAAFWTSSLLFYQMSLKMINVHLTKGIFPQVGLGYVHLASIIAGRLSHQPGMMDFVMETSQMAKTVFDRFADESYTIGRGQTLHSLFLGHLETHLRDQLPLLERAMDATILSGDKILSILNIGIVAAMKMWSSHDMAEVEAFCMYNPEEFQNWQEDLRGGCFLMSVRQYSRALQGKTRFRTAQEVLCDYEHDSEQYLKFIESRASSPERPSSIYLSYKVVVMFRFGHYREVIELAESLLKPIESLFCTRYVYSTMFYLALSYIWLLRQEPDHPDKTQLLARVDEYLKRIKTIASYNDVNYVVWIKLLEAEIGDVNELYRTALNAYEAALDHAEANGFLLDQGLTFELYANFLIRRGAKRPARRLVLDAIASYREIGAVGKADKVMEEYQWLTTDSRSLGTADVACQTTLIDTGNTAYRLNEHETQTNRDIGLETTQDRTDAFVQDQTSKSAEQGASAAGLDMIDLASILESSQVLSSELQVDRLAAKMTEIILEITGAELCGLVVEDEEVGWSCVAVAEPDGVTAYQAGQPLESVEDQVAKQITLYVLRFKETVFVHNLLEDERFANVSDAYLKRNPGGRAVIAMPIVHGNDVLLGSIYIEGRPNSFTDRNITVLRLLVNQISISIANAQLFKRLERVSASKEAMVEVQKGALKKAKAAEKKAKEAELEAMRMMRLKEEAYKTKSMFLANVSHELRTPLNGVIGMSELLKSSKLTPEQENYADSIRVCADTLLSIINDILDFSKLEAGKMKLFSVPLCLVECISEVVRALQYSTKKPSVDTIMQLDVDKDIFVLGDPVRLHQILMNLLSNSYKFTHQGSVTVKAVVNHEDAENIDVTISICDTGIGISEEQRKKLFLPFSQADNSTARSYGGTGLGLSICKAIVENVLRGRIWLESTPGVGTTVSFALKFQKVPKSSADKNKRTRVGEPDPMAIFSPPVAEGATSPPTSGFVNLSAIPRDDLRICIAEDNLINQKIAIQFVQRLGFKCEAFGDGRQTLNALERASREGNPFHLVLMDVQMPVLDGYDATREIRKHPDPAVRGVLVIAMTASAIRGDREKCLEAGMDNYLAKPVRANVLKQMVESYLNQPPKQMPNLETEALQLAKNVIETATSAEAGMNGALATDGGVQGSNGVANGPTVNGEEEERRTSVVRVAQKSPTNVRVERVGSDTSVSTVDTEDLGLDRTPTLTPQSSTDSVGSDITPTVSENGPSP